jgi:hypothetical protein
MMIRSLGGAYVYQIKFSREGGLICVLIGVAVIAVLAAVIFFIARRRK